MCCSERVELEAKVHACNHFSQKRDQITCVQAVRSTTIHWPPLDSHSTQPHIIVGMEKIANEGRPAGLHSDGESFR